jgi:transposase
VKSNEEIMEILEAYDLTGSYRRAAELVGCDHHTVARYVALRAAGGNVGDRTTRAKLIDEYMPKIEELVERSKGRIGADVVHDKLAAMGFAGADRTTRRAVAAVKKSYRAGNRRVHRPWIPEPGMWIQWDWGTGPAVGGRPTLLWCAWLAWSRFRVVLPVWDRAFPTVVACLDTTLRMIGGVPTYALTDNEKTVTDEHVAGIAVRNPEIVAVGRHYGLSILTCVVADPQSKGGVENAVKIARRDLVPTDVNLRGNYTDFAALEAACTEFCVRVNNRVHTASRRRPAEALGEERARLHPFPERPFTAAFGETRKVGWDATISVDGVRYSVPHTLVDTRVWVRFHGDELIVTAVDGGLAEVARHARATPGHPSIKDEHYPADHPDGTRIPRPTSTEEQEFLALGEGAVAWLTEAAAVGARRIRPHMAEAVALAKLHGTALVDRALGVAAAAGRFTDGDLAAIVNHERTKAAADTPSRAGETHSLQPGTGSWAAFTTPTNPATTITEESH